MRVCAIILAAGQGQRMGIKQSKTLLDIAGKPAITKALEAFEGLCEHFFVAVREEEKAMFETILKAFPCSFVIGGESRRQSVENCLNHIKEAYDVVLIHDGARPFVSSKLVQNIAEEAYRRGACIPAVKLSDSVKECENRKVIKSVEREKLYLVQTPQGFSLSLIKEAYEKNKGDETDDAALVSKMGRDVYIIQGEKSNIKLTDQEDYRMHGQNLIPRVGMGYDVHRFAENRKLIVCGIEIPHEKGLLGHSDADVGLHALCDALLGAAALGDIGSNFPDTSLAFKDVDSAILLEEVAKKLADIGYFPYNVDVTIVAQRPKFAPFILQMREKIAKILGIALDRVSVKATTTEHLGFEGRQEGISAHAVATITNK